MDVLLVLMKRSKFISSQSRRVLVGIFIGSIAAAIWHLISRDSVFFPTIRLAWRNLGLAHDFDGFRAYTPELSVAFIALLAIILIPGTRYIWRFMRAWWAGITSVTTTLAAVLTVVILLYGSHHQGIGIPFAVILLAVAIHYEYLRQKTPPASQFSNDLKLNMPEQASGPTRNQPWVLGSSDDPIDKWEQDILGRAAVVELLADYALRNRTPILALCGDFGDGKTSVLNLLRQAVEDRAIVVSFSAWLPGSETTLATDLFRDIVTECRKCVHVPQLRKHAVAYARTLSGSFSYLAGLREILPPQSQREEIDELREALALVPLPILVLLDDIDRMQREEILVLLKILRGAASIPNVTFVCAFSEREVKKALEKGGSLSDDYLEKFFPVTVNLAPPASEVLGALFREKLTDVFRQQNWFPNHESVKQFSELLERVWSDSLSRICTNVRKITLLLNDILIAARPITGEVNAFDLAVIETIRRFYPDVYRTVRTNPLFLTYATNDWSKGRLLVEDEKKEKSGEFFKSVMMTISKTEDPTAIEAMLSWIFPDFAAAKTKGASFFAIARPTSAEIAETERRICDPDYFPIYFRAAIPQEMFSNAELAKMIRDLTGAKTESAVESIFSRTLDEIPKGHPKRDDFLLKISRALDEVDNLTAERVAYAAATRAADYAYDVMNFGEAARALNIVFVAAQKLSGSSKAQEILEGAMARATDDTFAKRLLEFIQDRTRNKILTDFSNIDTDKVKHSFLERMRRRYGPSADINHVDIMKGDWWAFRIWSENSPEDAKMEQEFWRDFVGASRKRLAQTINFVYPGGNAIWSVDPRTIVDKLFPTAEMAQLLKDLPAENLDEVEEKGIQRFEALLQGKYPSHAGDFI
jgi:hypothetical protein